MALDPCDLGRCEVAIGHLDTGVDAAHPALHDKVAGFLYVDEAGDPQPGRAPFDSKIHGTHDAGIVAEIAPHARLYTAAVIEGGKTPLRILAALEWLLDKPIRILLLPLGVAGDTPFLIEVLDAFRARGVLVVAAVGNRGSSKYVTPGGYDGVLSVGAAGGDEAVPRFSGSRYAAGTERCAKPDVLAPGVDILSAEPGGGSVRDSGTSMASAHVAGVAASLWHACPDASAEAIETALVRTAVPLPAAWQHRCRTGVVDAEAALAYLRALRDPPERWRPAPRPVERYVDPRLARKMMFLSDDAELEVLLVRRPEGDPAHAPLEQVVERCARTLGSPPSLVRPLHRGALCLVRGPVRLLAALFSHPAVAAAQATEVDAIAG